MERYQSDKLLQDKGFEMFGGTRKAQLVRKVGDGPSTATRFVSMARLYLSVDEFLGPYALEILPLDYWKPARTAL
jgi:hypothetical protein